MIVQIDSAEQTGATPPADHLHSATPIKIMLHSWAVLVAAPVLSRLLLVATVALPMARSLGKAAAELQAEEDLHHGRTQAVSRMAAGLLHGRTVVAETMAAIKGTAVAMVVTVVTTRAMAKVLQAQPLHGASKALKQVTATRATKAMDSSKVGQLHGASSKVATTLLHHLLLHVSGSIEPFD